MEDTSRLLCANSCPSQKYIPCRHSTIRWSSADTAALHDSERTVSAVCRSQAPQLRRFRANGFSCCWGTNGQARGTTLLDRAHWCDLATIRHDISFPDKHLHSNQIITVWLSRSDRHWCRLRECGAHSPCALCNGEERSRYVAGYFLS